MDMKNVQACTDSAVIILEGYIAEFGPRFWGQFQREQPLSGGPQRRLDGGLHHRLLLAGLGGDRQGYLPADDAAKYTGFAHRLAQAMADKCAVKDASVTNGLLLHGVYGKSGPYNTVWNAGVDECTCWGDHFWFDLLTRLKNPDWNLYW